MVRKVYISILAACMALVSCSEKINVVSSDEESADLGYVSLAMKSSSGTNVAFGEFSIIIVDKATSEVVKTMKYGKAPVVAIAPGTYTILAENCTEAEAEAGDGRQRISGRGVSDVEIVAGAVAVSRIECCVTTAKVTVEFLSGFAEQFSDYRIVFTDGRDISIGASDTGREVYWNVPENGLKLSFRIEGTAKEDNSLKTTTGSVTLKRGEHSNLKFNP